MQKFIVGLLLLSVFLTGIGLLLKHLWIRTVVQQRWDDFTQQTPAMQSTSVAGTDAEERWWLGHWLFLAGFRRPGADVLFIVATLVLTLLGTLVAGGFRWSGLQQLMETSIVQAPGGVGETFLPIVWVARGCC